jgi:hypothetical protein
MARDLVSQPAALTYPGQASLASGLE